MKNGLIMDEYGTNHYYLNNKRHREDGPALEYSDGSKFWYLHGKPHREDGPAIKWADGDEVWLLNGERHREDGPAIEWKDGSKFWFLNGKKHRVDGPAQIWPSGSQFWWLHGKELIHPPEFITMEAFFQELNDNEEYSLQWISDFNGIINMIKEPSGKQTRLNAMRWKI